MNLKTFLNGIALFIGLGLIAHCLEWGTAIALRDGAVISVLRCGGIRRQELVRLTIADVKIETGAVLVRYLKISTNTIHFFLIFSE